MAIFTVPEWIAPPEISALSSTSLRVEWDSSEGHGVVARGQVVEYQVSLLTEQTDNPHAPPLISQVKHYFLKKILPPDLKTSVLLHNIGFSFSGRTQDETIGTVCLCCERTEAVPRVQHYRHSLHKDWLHYQSARGRTDAARR